MIKIHLMGGLGNQMFQYAAASAVAREKQLVLKPDFRWFQQDFSETSTPRQYELDCFELHEKMKNVEPKILERLAFLWAGKYVEEDFTYSPTIHQIRDNTSLLGYFQSEKYFKNIRKELIDDFKWVNKPNKKNSQILHKISIDRGRSVSLHVRRGDYVTNKQHNEVHGLVTLDYYKRAIKYMQEKIKSPQFYIFSDDPEWCRAHLKMVNSHVVSHNISGADDLRLMKACDHNIIANSSFSWWGAWLGEQSHKLVVAPKRWFNDANINTKDLLPEQWQKL